jgi:hypothetical protein
MAPVGVTKTVTVSNVVPHTIQVDSPASIDESAVAQIDISLVDPGPLDTHRVVIDWGDGGPTETIFLPRGVFSIEDVPHRYRNDAPGGAGFTITARVFDDDEPQSAGTATALLVVNNRPPAADPPLVQGPLAILEGDLVKVSGSFTDPGIDHPLGRWRRHSRFGRFHKADLFGQPSVPRRRSHHHDVRCRVDRGQHRRSQRRRRHCGNCADHPQRCRRSRFCLVLRSSAAQTATGCCWVRLPRASAAWRFTATRGADFFENSGEVAGLEFVGGAGNDRLFNSQVGELSDVAFTGDDGADVFANSGEVSDLEMSGGGTCS